MPPQTLQQRLTRLLSDANDPSCDIHARWEKIVKDGPGAEASALFGEIPEPTLDDVDPQVAINYAARDADATLRVYPHLKSQIDSMGLDRALALDQAIVPMVASMQRNGMLVDTSHLADLSATFDLTLQDLSMRASESAGKVFNLASSDQVAEILFDHLGLRGRRKTGSGKRYSTDEKVLSSLLGAHPLISIIQEHREVSKLKGTYVDVLPKLLSPDGRIRMELGMTTVPSGRLNCYGGVNLLGIPVRTALGREIRRAFVAAPGNVLCSVDLNQIELRWLAILSGDERMLDAFLHGRDLHKLTASQLYHVPFDSVTFEQRQRGKTLNFAIANQISALGLYDQFIVAGITDLDEVECQRYLDQWYDFYSAVPSWFESVYSEGRRWGYIRDSVSGRILYCPGLRSDLEKVMMDTQRVCTNWKIQTAAQATLKMGMVEVWSEIKGSEIMPLLQVHDELIFEFESSLCEYSSILADLVVSGAPKTPIPILAGNKTAANWAELK